ncbi:restriction endonuclease subunit S [Pantoea osteomyelitidis]|uniref:Restriction endonuclease subunit S n=1 Tax=Pantoea osteomyelitidis TaxID=3230026 RepID=A0ABW7PSG3_9GAMM
MSADNKVPEIRFKSFSGGWKNSELSELALFNPKSELPESFKYVDLESVKGTSLIGYKIESRNSAPSRAQRLAQKGDVFYQTVRPYQKNNYLFHCVENDYVFSTGYAQLRPYFNGNFLLNLVQRDLFVKSVLNNCTGTSYPAINASTLATIGVSYPKNEAEQTQIGNYFQKLDALINQHQQKHDKLSNIKKSMLEKMFPKQGETIPEIRFKGFSGEWEEASLLDSIERIIDFRGRTPKKLGLDWSPSGYRALSALNVKQGYIDFSIDPHFGDQELYDKWMSGSELHQGQVLFTTEAPMGNVAQVPNTDKYILSQRTIAFIVKSEIVVEDFLAVLLRSSKVFRELSALSSGGTAKGVSQKVLANLNVSIPTNLVEQTAIGNYFQKLDNLINQHQQQITKLNNIKQACLSKMFV